MCDPVSITLGAVSAAGGMMQAQAQHQAATAAADRQNLINEQNYQQQLAISARKDELKGLNFKAKMEAHASAQSALARQKQINQLEATRASIQAQQVRKEKFTEAAFKGQQNLAESIKAQGAILASGQQAGQSMLLTLMDTERQLGFKEAQITASLYDANVAYGLQEYGINLDKYSADTAAVNQLPAKPVAPSASFAPIKKPKVEGPSGLGLMGGMIGAAAGGFSTGVSAHGTFAEHGMFGVEQTKKSGG